MSAGQYLDVPAAAQIILDGVVAHYVASGVSLPDLRYIGPGSTRELAWDCESVLVSCAGIVWGQGPGVGSGTARRTGNPLASGSTRYGVFSVQIVRCVPVYGPEENPDAAVLNQAGNILLRDFGLLSQALTELCGDRGPLRRWGTAIPGDAEPLGPAGGFSAAEGHLSVTLARLAPG